MSNELKSFTNELNRCVREYQISFIQDCIKSYFDGRMTYDTSLYCDELSTKLKKFIESEKGNISKKIKNSIFYMDEYEYKNSKVVVNKNLSKILDNIKRRVTSHDIITKNVDDEFDSDDFDEEENEYNDDNIVEVEKIDIDINDEEEYILEENNAEEIKDEEPIPKKKKETKKTIDKINEITIRWKTDNHLQELLDSISNSSIEVIGEFIF